MLEEIEMRRNAENAVTFAGIFVGYEKNETCRTSETKCKRKEGSRDSMAF